MFKNSNLILDFIPKDVNFIIYSGAILSQEFIKSEKHINTTLKKFLDKSNVKFVITGVQRNYLTIKKRFGLTIYKKVETLIYDVGLGEYCININELHKIPILISRFIKNYDENLVKYNKYVESQKLKVNVSLKIMIESLVK